MRIHMLYHKKTVRLLVFLLLMFLTFLLVEILKGEEYIYYCFSEIHRLFDIYLWMQDVV